MSAQRLVDRLRFQLSISRRSVRQTVVGPDGGSRSQEHATKALPLDLTHHTEQDSNVKETLSNDTLVRNQSPLVHNKCFCI